MSIKILLGHNYYRERGGEDAVVETEKALLEQNGEQVLFYRRHNAELTELSLYHKIRLLSSFEWSAKTYTEIKDLIKTNKPDIAHFHNIFYMMTPSAYDACFEAGVPVVQSLHNFRLLCANGLFYCRNDNCEACREKTLWEGTYRKCFRDSYLLSFLMVKLLTKYWRNRTWIDKVDLNIAPSEFTRQKYIEAGIPADKIIVKPHSLFPDVGRDDSLNKERKCALFIGRLSQEKGAHVLIDAWKNCPEISLKIIGDGPSAELLKEKAKGLTNVEFLGRCSYEQCQDYLRNAAFLVIPSVCYENFPRVIVEAYAHGTTVLASRIGCLPELVIDGKTGILFEADNPSDLSAKACILMKEKEKRCRMADAARAVYEEKYLSAQNYANLTASYRLAMEKSVKKVH